MDESKFGVRDKRGDWKPFKLIEYPPVFVWPPQVIKFLKWLFGFPGYLLPYNLFYGGIGILLWVCIAPLMPAMKALSLSWIAPLFALNTGLVLLYYGAFHLRLYIQKKQGHSFKYNSKWPSKDNPVFLFRSQTADNLFRAFTSAIPIATTYQVLTLWAFANGYLPTLVFQDHPVYFIVLMFLVPSIYDIHFYIIHRLIHWPPLYRTVHHVHHNNVNPGPWSGLAMHPVEHLLYFSGVFIYWIIPAHPLHALFHTVYTMLAPAPGHVGFDKVVLGDGSVIDTNSYAHYLHHKYFECNYSDDIVPIDKWFGTFHDGSPESQERMDKCFMERAARRAEREAKRG